MEIFNLKDVKFPKRRKGFRNGGTPSEYDLGVNITFDKKKGEHFLSLSFKKSITDTFPSNRVSAALVNGKGGSRLYIVAADDGYKVTQINKQVNRTYARIPIENYVEYSKCVGEHELHYDKFNEAYYVEL